MMQARVLIIGSGIAGAAASLSARGVALSGIDRAERFGGTAARAGGGYCAVGTDEQRARGVFDSPALALADLLRGQEELVDLDWARKYLRLSDRLVHRGFVGLGVSTAKVLRFERDSVPRWHHPVGGGAALMAAIKARSTCEWRHGLRLTGLIQADGRIQGVTSVDVAGREHRIEAEAVIVATGGFAQNGALVARHASGRTQGQPFLTAGGAMAGGDALAILESVGAGFSGLERVYFYPFITREPGSDRGVAIRGLDRGLWLNADGHRFLDESKVTLGQSAATTLFAQPGSWCWAVVDAASLPGIAIADHYCETPETPAQTLARYVDGSPDVIAADSLATLAERMGLAALPDACRAWNALIAKGGSDPLTGRPLDPADGLSRPPFLAVRLRPGARKTLGGVRTDLHAHVVTPDGTPIPGLYAAGEVAGFAGGSIAGEMPLEGMMVGASFLSGLIAGRHASREALRRAAHPKTIH